MTRQLVNGSLLGRELAFLPTSLLLLGVAVAAGQMVTVAAVVALVDTENSRGSF
jgi:hypothetical protein